MFIFSPLLCQTGYLIPSRLRKADDCCQVQGVGQSCRYHLGNGREKAAPQACPGAWHFTGNACHGGEGSRFPPDPLDAGARALENVLRLECFRGAALLLPMLSMHLSEMMQDIRRQQSEKTRSQRRSDSAAQTVKAGGIDLQSHRPSDIGVHVGTAYLSLRGHSFTTARFTLG